MTIEQEFFEAFGIRKIRRCELDDECFMGFGHSCKECDIYGQAYEVYPPITPEIVLKLAATLNDIVFSKIECCCLFTGKTVEEITNNILSDCIDHKDEIQNQVKALFNA